MRRNLRCVKERREKTTGELDKKQGMLVEYQNNEAVGRMMMAAMETGNEGRRIIRSQSSQRD